MQAPKLTAYEGLDVLRYGRAGFPEKDEGARMSAATVSILRRHANAPSRRVEVFVERVFAEAAKLPTDEEQIAYLKEVLKFMESKPSKR
jgi:hypothetical protein